MDVHLQMFTDVRRVGFHPRLFLSKSDGFKKTGVLLTGVSLVIDTCKYTSKLKIKDILTMTWLKPKPVLLAVGSGMSSKLRTGAGVAQLVSK